jgi:hypothetical protein
MIASGLLKLWTWQNERFDIANGDQRVSAKENSIYQSNKRHMEAYEILWKQKIGHDQFHWYFTDWISAKAHAHTGEFADRADDYQLWEVTVDESSILRKVCGVAWAWIVHGNVQATPPCWGYDSLPNEIGVIWKSRDEFDAAFARPWSGLTEPQLWDHLFVDSVVPGCTQVLLKHPVDPCCVRRINKADLRADGQSASRQRFPRLCAGCLIERNLYKPTEQNS